MKAEEVLHNKILAYYEIDKLATLQDVPFIIYIESMQEYARIQIEKDRERLLMQIYEDDGAELNSTSFSKTPIILD
jgi:hypothetical protein